MSDFVTGQENRLASVAADVITSGRWEYNPIVFFGPPGTGKTCLACGMAEQWRLSHQGNAGRQATGLILTTGNDFAQEYRLAVDTDSLMDLRRKYRRTPLLVIDDVHQAAGKRATQNELLCTIDALLEANRLVVATSRHNPLETADLLPALAGRLVQGLTVPIVPPGPAARRAIIQRLAEQQRIKLTVQVIDILVQYASGDAKPAVTVPQLEYLLKELSRFAFENKAPIDVPLTKQLLEENDKRHEPQLRAITKMVSRHFKLRVSDLKGAGRQQRVVRARGIAILLARRLTSYSLEQLGQHFGKRDHSTVLHACRKTEALMMDDPTIRQTIEQLTTQLSEEASRMDV